MLLFTVHPRAWSRLALLPVQLGHDQELQEASYSSYFFYSIFAALLSPVLVGFNQLSSFF